MKVCFIYAEKERENVLADAFCAGVIQGGDEAIKVKKEAMVTDFSHDVYCMVGVKSIRTFHAMLAAGKRVLFFDKGYFRHRGTGRTWEYWRIAVDSHHPTNYIGNAQHSSKRWERISNKRCVRPREWRTPNHPGWPIVIAGSSEKYNAFCQIKPPTEYAERLVRQIRKQTKRPIIYRPKPTWLDAVPIRGTTFSGPEQNIYDVLQNAWCVVTHGSNTCFEAVLHGVPNIILGNGIARPISSTDIECIEAPRLAAPSQRDQWLANVAWCMFTEEEMENGLAWQALKPQFSGEFLDDSMIRDADIAGANTKKPTKAMLKRIGEWHDRRGKKDQELKLQKRLNKAMQREHKPFTKIKVVEEPDLYEGPLDEQV